MTRDAQADREKLCGELITEEDKNELVEKLFSPIIQKRFSGAVEDAKDDICPSCKQKITEFRDRQSIAEYKISGLCQKCQDRIFGED